MSENEKTPPTTSGDGTESGRSVATDSHPVAEGGGGAPSPPAGRNGTPTPVEGTPEVSSRTPTPVD
ncbi:MAG: hypothetical protein OJJ54_12110, partial [Pseudonocardia sp.]|nr:hypothetical protein [Pseudonocardia sp.]